MPDPLTYSESGLEVLTYLISARVVYSNCQASCRMASSCISRVSCLVSRNVREKAIAFVDTFVDMNISSSDYI